MTPRTRAPLTLAALGVLALTGCDSSGGTDPAPPVPESTSASPTPPARTTTFTELAPTEFSCDCPALPVGAGPDGEVAVAAGLPLPSDPSADDLRVEVLDPEGSTRWSQDLEVGTVSGAPEAPALAAPSALVVLDGEELQGLAWDDGEELWQVDAAQLPLQAGAEGEQLVLASTLFSDAGTSHPEVALFGAADGELVWQGEDLTGYTVDTVTGDLVLLEAGEQAATLIRVAPGSGEESVVEVPDWAGRVLNLASADGVVRAFVGEEDTGESRQLAVDWQTGELSEPPAEPSAPGSQQLVATSEDGRYVLGAELDGAGAPTTAHLGEVGGSELWQRPAAEVLSWTGSGEDVSFADVQVAPTAEAAGGVVLVERTQITDGSETWEGAAADETAPAVTALDLSTGEDLWADGGRDAALDVEVVAEDGLVVLASGGPLDPYAGEATPWTVSLLDLRSGEPDWEVDGAAETLGLTVQRYDTTLLVAPEGSPWQVAQRTER